MTLDESVHGMRLRVIERAQVVGNVSAVCRDLGISRTLFYRWRKRLTETIVCWWSAPSTFLAKASRGRPIPG